MSSPKTIEMLCYCHDPSGNVPLARLSLSLDGVNALIQMMLRAHDALKCDNSYRYAVYCGHYVDIVDINGSEDKESLWEIADACMEHGSWEMIEDVVEKCVPWPPKSCQQDMQLMYVTSSQVHWEVRQKHVSHDLTTETISKDWLHELQKRLLLAEIEDNSN